MHELNLIYPNLQLDYITGESEQLKKLLLNHEIDILIDENTFDGEISSVQAFEDQCIFITHKHNKEKFENKTVDENMCSKNPLYVVSINKFVKKIIELYPEFKYEDIRSTPLMLFKLSNSDNIGLAPKIILTRGLQSGEFIELNTNIAIPKAKMYASYIKRLSNKKIYTVINFFKENNYYELLDENKEISS